MSEEGLTSYTLLERALDHSDDRAWQELIEKYQKFIFFILREKGVPERELEDLAQSILGELVTQLPKYNRESGKFRSWFAQIVKNKAVYYYRRNGAYSRKVNRFKELVVDVSGEAENELENYIEEEWLNYVTRIAVERVSSSYSNNVMTVFRASLSGKSTKQVAEELNVSEQTVYTYRMRVKQSLKLEVKRVLAELEGYRNE